MDYSIDRNYVCEKLLSIIRNVTNVNVTDKDSSLFSLKHNISPESFTYILLMASKELHFVINDEFVEALKDYSYNSITHSIIEQMSI